MANLSAKDTNPDYWEQYSNLQQVKHDLIQHYLSGWLPKLGSWSGRVQYVETHAGRGRHESGDYGSPLVALRTLLRHSSRESVFGSCEVAFRFIEEDKENCESLEKEIASLGPLPKQVKVEVICAECFGTLRGLLQHLEESQSRLAPAFIFVDPYGFKIPARTLRELMAFPRVELFVNLIWRELSMSIAQGDSVKGMAATLDQVFDGTDWRMLVDLQFERQAEACVGLLRQKIGAKWVTHIRMLGNNNATRYMLMHLTNHDAGRDLMKDCMWKVSPDAAFRARAGDDFRQEFLIKPEPDLSPLKEWVRRKLSEKPCRWKSLIEDLRAEVWRAPQLNHVISDLRKDGKLDGRDYSGKFSPGNNPELHLAEQKR